MARLSGSEGSELLAHYVESEMDPGVRVRRFVVTQTRLSPGGLLASILALAIGLSGGI